MIQNVIVNVPIDVTMPNVKGHSLAVPDYGECQLPGCDNKIVMMAYIPYCKGPHYEEAQKLGLI